MTPEPALASPIPGPSRIAIGIALVCGLVLIAALGSTYFGHSTSPYGNCFGPSGRPGPCVVVARKLTSSDSAQLARALGATRR